MLQDGAAVAKEVNRGRGGREVLNVEELGVDQRDPSWLELASASGGPCLERQPVKK